MNHFGFNSWLRSAAAVFMSALAFPVIAGVQCISGPATMQQAIANEAARTTGTSEFRFRAVTLTDGFVFAPTVPGSNRTIVVDGGWNSGCSTKIAGAKTVIPSITLRALYPNHVTTSDITISNLQLAAPVNVVFGQGPMRVRDNKIMLGQAVSMELRGTPLSMLRNQFLGGELYAYAGRDSGLLDISNNEMRDMERVYITSETTGSVSVRNNTITFRNYSPDLPFGFNVFELRQHGDAVEIAIANNLLGRSTTYDVWPHASTGVYLLLDQDANGWTPPLTLLHNWIQSYGSGVVHGTDEFTVEWDDPANRNVELRGALPFDAGVSAAYLIPATTWGGINAGSTVPADGQAVDLRGQPRLVGGRTDIGAHESDVLSSDGFEHAN